MDFSDLKCPKGKKFNPKVPCDHDVTGSLYNNIYWCKSNDDSCEFAFPFGYSYMCECPVLQEVDKRKKA